MSADRRTPKLVPPPSERWRSPGDTRRPLALATATADWAEFTPAAGPRLGKRAGGRGIGLVHELTRGRWGATLLPNGKTVHADLRTDAL
jgi:hypothetical protein